MSRLSAVIIGAILVLVVTFLALVALALLILCVALLKWIRDHDVADPFDGRDEEYFDYAWSQIIGRD